MAAPPMATVATTRAGARTAGWWRMQLRRVMSARCSLVVCVANAGSSAARLADHPLTISSCPRGRWRFVCPMASRAMVPCVKVSCQICRFVFREDPCMATLGTWQLGYPAVAPCDILAKTYVRHLGPFPGRRASMDADPCDAWRRTNLQASTLARRHDDSLCRSCASRDRKPWKPEFQSTSLPWPLRGTEKRLLLCRPGNDSKHRRDVRRNLKPAAWPHLPYPVWSACDSLPASGRFPPMLSCIREKRDSWLKVCCNAA